jgi:hypothetical protein
MDRKLLEVHPLVLCSTKNFASCFEDERTFGYCTVKLGYSEHPWNHQQILFIITRDRYNREGHCSKHGFRTEKMKKILLYIIGSSL